MVKIVVTQPLGLNEEHENRLKKLGDTVIYRELPETHDERLKRCKGADVICSGIFGLKQEYQKLHDVFISLCFVGVDFLDKSILKDNNITVANSPGSNKQAVTEWIIYMLLSLHRKFHDIGTFKEENNKCSEVSKGLLGRNICILGKGNIGNYVGKVCESFGMEVTFFLRGDDLHEKTSNMDVIVNTLSHSSETEGLLDRNFFFSCKKGTFFITITREGIYDSVGMIDALDEGILGGVATDCGSIKVRNVNDPFYKKMNQHPKVLATPHISWESDISDKKGGDIMIDNIEKRIMGDPQNIV